MCLCVWGRDALKGRTTHGCPILSALWQVSAWIEATEAQLASEARAELGRMRAAAEADAQALLAAMTQACLGEQQAAVEALVEASPCCLAFP